MANPLETAAIRLVTVRGTVAVLRSVAASLRSSSTDELAAALLIKETCTAAATGLFVLGSRGALSPESISCCLAPTDEGSRMSTADYALLLRCLVDGYEILIPTLACTLAQERSGGREDVPWATTCACCLDAALAIVDSFALQPLVTGAAPAAPLAFLAELIRYEAGAELPLGSAMSSGSAAHLMRPQARGALVADLFALGGVLQRLEAIAAPALSSESSPAAFVSALLQRHCPAAVGGAPSSQSLRAPIAIAGAAASGSSGGGGGSASEGGALAALLDILPGVDAAAADAALRACGGDVAAAVERLVSAAESDIEGGGGAAAVSKVEDAASLALAPVRTRRGDQVPAVDAALKAATLRRVDDMDARAAAAAAARLLDGRADSDGRGGVVASAAALAVFGPLGDAYADEYDDTYDDAVHLDVPGGEGSSAGGSSDGDDGHARAGRKFRGPPVSHGGAGAVRGGRGSSSSRGGRGGSSASYDNPTARLAPAAGAYVKEGGDASGGDAGDGTRHSRRGRGGGGEAARVGGRGGGESEVTGHGPRARGGVTEHDAARRRELKARLGNHNRKRGADRKLFGRGGGSAGGAPGGGAAL